LSGQDTNFNHDVRPNNFDIIPVDLELVDKVRVI